MLEICIPIFYYTSEFPPNCIASSLAVDEARGVSRRRLCPRWPSTHVPGETSRDQPTSSRRRFYICHVSPTISRAIQLDRLFNWRYQVETHRLIRGRRVNGLVQSEDEITGDTLNPYCCLMLDPRPAGRPPLFWKSIGTIASEHTAAAQSEYNSCCHCQCVVYTRFVLECKIVRFSQIYKMLNFSNFDELI